MLAIMLNKHTGNGAAHLPNELILTTRLKPTRDAFAKIPHYRAVTAIRTPKAHKPGGRTMPPAHRLGIDMIDAYFKEQHLSVEITRTYFPSPPVSEPTSQTLTTEQALQGIPADHVESKEDPYGFLRTFRILIRPGQPVSLERLIKDLMMLDQEVEIVHPNYLAQIHPLEDAASYVR